MQNSFQALRCDSNEFKVHKAWNQMQKMWCVVLAFSCAKTNLNLT